MKASRKSSDDTNIYDNKCVLTKQSMDEYCDWGDNESDAVFSLDSSERVKRIVVRPMSFKDKVYHVSKFTVKEEKNMMQQESFEFSNENCFDNQNSTFDAIKSSEKNSLIK